MPNDILQYFEPLSSVIKKVTDGAQQLIEVSAWRYTQLEDYTKYLEAELAAEREKNRYSRCLDEDDSTLMQEN